MKKLLSSILLILSFCFCNGRNEVSVQHLIDSLDNIHHSRYQKVKPKGCAYTIKVKNQEEFDALNNEITKAIKSGKKNIKVKLRQGVYQFHQEHICRKNEHTDASICFIGNKAVITSDKNYAKTYGNGNGWQEMRYADSIIQVVDEKTKLCVIPYANKMSELEKKGMTKVQITQWFRAKTYKVERVDQRGIYFIAPELAWEISYGHKGYNVNFDYLYLGKTPRFRVYDTSKEPTCTAARFLTMEQCSYYSLTIKGIEFRGANVGNILLYFTNVDAKQITIKDCTFDYIRGDGVAYFSATGKVIFDNNFVSNTGGDELFFTNDCPNVRITNNTFENCGQNLGSKFCVRCYESDYYIAHNTFRDFGYGAIGVGVWHGFDKKYYSGGIIEHNEIYFSPTYFANVWKYMLMDSGAIYIWTQNDVVIIRDNYIHDYNGAGDNRGVFCDDGACNLKIYRNMVVRIPNSYCIDSRASKDQKAGFTNNANNFMAQNIVDGRVRFQGYGEEERHCVKGANYVVKSDRAIENKIENLEVNVEDVEVQGVQEVQKFKEFKNYKYKIKL